MKIAPIFRTTLAEDMPPGPQGQPAHKKGAEIVMSCVLDTSKLGRFGMVTPNPVFFYLNYAEESINNTSVLLKKIDSSNKEWHMFAATETTPDDKFRDLDGDQIYEFLQKAIIIPIFLFTALEAFTNQLIPTNYIYKKSSSLLFWKSFKNMNKVEIERRMSTGDKLSIILTQLRNKQIKDTHLWQKYRKLKDLRDELIHLKTREQQSVVAYNELFKTLVDVDYQDLFDSTKKIMEFYIPDYFS